MAAVNAPRFTPIVERPVRTVQAYRSRKAKAQREALHDKLKAEIEKGKTS
jgi:hypothetical protein